MKFVRNVRHLLPLFVVASGLALVQRPAAAQTATFCNGALHADSIYSTVASNGKISKIDYYLQLRNTTNVDQLVNARFILTNPNHPIVNRLGTTVRLLKYASQRLLLGTETLNNPVGNGKLTEAEMKPAISITCQK